MMPRERSASTGGRSRKWLLLIGGLLAILCLGLALACSERAPDAAGDPLHVDGAGGQDTPACGPRSAPCRTVGYALGRAAPADTVRVAQGVYTENLVITQPVILEGGYEAAGWKRDPARYVTILDGIGSPTAGADWDASALMCAVVSDSGKFKMWYQGYDPDFANPSIGYAESADGVHWIKYAVNPVLADAESPHVRREGGLPRMWYSADGAIAYTTSTDGLHWERYAGNPVLTPGGAAEWDGEGIWSPWV